MRPADSEDVSSPNAAQRLKATQDVAVRSRRGWWRFAFAVTLSGFSPAGYSCGVANLEPRVPDVTPTPSTAGMGRGLSGGKGGLPSVKGRPLTLPPVNAVEYEPILAAAPFAAVRAALEDEQPDLALSEFRRYLETLSALEQQKPELQYQLGKLAAGANEWALALRAFGACAQTTFALQGYCKYWVAKAQVNTGASARAVNTLGAISAEDGAVLLQNARRLRGQAAYLSVNDVVAVRELRAELRENPNTPGWTQSALLLAQALARSPQLPGPEGTSSPILPPAETDSNLEERLSLLRRVQIEAPGTSMAKEATALEKALLAALNPVEAARLSRFTPEQELLRVRALVEAREFTEAVNLVDRVLAGFSLTERSASLGCELQFLRNKAQTTRADSGTALTRMLDLLTQCRDKELRSKALYLAGKYAFSDKQYGSAISCFLQLEQENPQSSLADDARLRSAEAYLELKDTEHFVSALETLPGDYPDGDMLLDGVFRLAVFRVEQGDWKAARKLLESILTLARAADAKRDQEYAGRERYFWARALIETGEGERGLQEFAGLVRERPFSYYMQLAAARLVNLEPARLDAARSQAAAETALQYPNLALTTRIPEPAFERALALLRQAETSFAALELKSIPPAPEYSAAKLSWVNARLFAPSDTPKLTQQWARDRGAEWLPHWPDGQWRELWELAFPRPHRDVVRREAKRNALRESLIYAVMREESGFEPKAVSPAQAYGLMQLIRPTAKRFAKELGLRYSERALFRPATNIALGSRALRNYQDFFPDNPLLAIPGYNAGPGRPRKWLKEASNLDFDIWVELIPFLETRRYTKRVLSSMGAYEFLYSKPATLLPLPVKLQRDIRDVALNE